MYTEPIPEIHRIVIGGKCSGYWNAGTSRNTIKLRITVGVSHSQLYCVLYYL